MNIQQHSTIVYLRNADTFDCILDIIREMDRS